MSFRSRSNARPIAPPRRRSSSLTRAAGTTNGSYPSSSRPISMHGSSINSPMNYQSSQSPGNFHYGSNQNLSSMKGNDYYNGRSAYGSGVTNGTLKFPLTTMNTSSSSYNSPYKDRYSQNYYMNGSSGPSSSSGYTSVYKDRNYYSPYSSYENGVTTASLSIPGPSSVKRDAYSSRGSNLMSTSTSGIGGSSSNLMNNSQGIVNLGRSQSLREQERKSRSRRCKEAAKNAVPDSAVPYDPAASNLLTTNGQKSISTQSLQSEGYEVRLVIKKKLRKRC